MQKVLKEGLRMTVGAVTMAGNNTVVRNALVLPADTRHEIL